MSLSHKSQKHYYFGAKKKTPTKSPTTRSRAKTPKKVTTPKKAKTPTKSPTPRSRAKTPKKTTPKKATPKKTTPRSLKNKKETNDKEEDEEDGETSDEEEEDEEDAESEIDDLSDSDEEEEEESEDEEEEDEKCSTGKLTIFSKNKEISNQKFKSLVDGKSGIYFISNEYAKSPDDNIYVKVGKSTHTKKSYKNGVYKGLSQRLDSYLLCYPTGYYIYGIISVPLKKQVTDIEKQLHKFMFYFATIQKDINHGHQTEWFQTTPNEIRIFLNAFLNYTNIHMCRKLYYFEEPFLLDHSITKKKHKTKNLFTKEEWQDNKHIFDLLEKSRIKINKTEFAKNPRPKSKEPQLTERVSRSSISQTRNKTWLRKR
jgi:hypothetical protein